MPAPILTFREVTDANRAEVVALHAGPAQGRFVSSVADSMEEAVEWPHANPWYRAVYAGDEPIGFVMLSWDVEPEPPDVIGPWFLWKLLVDERHQRRGYGREIVRMVAEIVRREGGTELLTSHGVGDGSPAGFYERLGFVPTGDYDPDGERILRLELTPERSVFEAGGGMDGMRRLAAAWHARVMADEVVTHAFSHGFHPQHTERLAAYWAEALGGPPAYTDAYGDETSVVRMHSGNGLHEEMDRRAIACFDQALTDAGLTADPRLAQVLHDYFAWATTASMARYHASADDVPSGLRIPRWSWDGLVREEHRRMSDAPVTRRP